MPGTIARPAYPSSMEVLSVALLAVFCAECRFPRSSRRKIVMQSDIESGHIPKRASDIHNKKHTNLMPIKRL